MPPGATAQVLERVEAGITVLGCELNMRKTGFFTHLSNIQMGATQIQRLDAIPLVLKLPMPVSVRNDIIDYDVSKVASILQARKDMFDRMARLVLAGLSAHTASALARYHVGGDYVYLVQSLLMPLALQDQMDNVVLRGASALVGMDAAELTDGMREQWFQPWASGGFGWQSVRHGAEAQYLSSWCRELGVVAAKLGHTSATSFLHTVPALRDTLIEAHRRMNEKWAYPRNLDDALQDAGTDAPKPQSMAKMWRKQVVARSMYNYECGATREHLIAMKAAGGPGAGMWMALPALPQHHLTNQEFSTAMRSRAGCDAFSALQVCQHCATDKNTGRITPCTSMCDMRGDHARLCRLGGWVVRRHNAMRDALSKEIESVSAFPVHVEQHDESLPDDQRHPDIDYYDHNARRRWIDVAVVSPWTRSWPAETQVVRPGVRAANMEGIKRHKYQHLPLIPAVWEHLGRPGSGVRTLIRSLHAGCDPSKRSPASSCTWQTMSVCLQRPNVAMLAAAGPLIPAPGG